VRIALTLFALVLGVQTPAPRTFQKHVLALWDEKWLQTMYFEALKWSMKQ
jgi:hypothetical protein